MPSQVIQHAFPHSSFMDINLVHSGSHNCDSMHCYGPAIRNYYLFHYIQKGRGSFYLTTPEGKHIEYALQAGQGFLICPGLQHTYIAHETDPWSYIWVGFDGVKSKGVLAQAGLTTTQPIYTSKQIITTKSNVEDAILRISNNANGPLFELMGYLYLFLNALVESSADSKKIAKNGVWEFYVQEILVFIEENYHKDIGMTEISKICNLEKNHVGKIFKTVLGVNFRDYLIQYRINKACELMRITSHSIGEISIKVGYSNMFNFSRVFKSVIGMSPSKWRESNRLQ